MYRTSVSEIKLIKSSIFSISCSLSVCQLKHKVSESGSTSQFLVNICTVILINFVNVSYSYLSGLRIIRAVISDEPRYSLTKPP